MKESQEKTTLKNNKAVSKEANRQYFLKVLNLNFSERNDVIFKFKYVKN